MKMPLIRDADRPTPVAAPADRNLSRTSSPAPSRGTLSRSPSREPFVEIRGERYLVVDDCRSLAPFLVNVVSADDHWMFVTSNGGITAGRRTPDEAIFPYCNQDQLFESTGSTGALTILRLTGPFPGAGVLWEPWAPCIAPGSPIERRLYKNVTGSSVIFEETHPAIGLRWRHEWSCSAVHGIVRRAEIVNTGAEPVTVNLLDGFRNLLPHGLKQLFQSQFSVLGDAYKTNELIRPEGIGVFSLSSLPTDRAEPNESLRATVAWSVGLEVKTHLLSSVQVEAFRAGRALREESAVRGRRGAFLIEGQRVLEPGEEAVWWTVADVGVAADGLTGLAHWLRSEPDPGAQLEAAVRSTRTRLRDRVASVDGIQSTADELRCWRHFSNALFNIMRGGVFELGCDLPREDFLRKLERGNREVFRRHLYGLRNLPERFNRGVLEELAAGSGDPNFRRWAGEYLPLGFSRRHGDPSRPWNRFAIDICEADGSPRLAYQGNWRDIFQNWEALIHAFPDFTEATILRFLNASTADGYNPYRLTDRGFEWEVTHPDEPWSNIGYWGDHQIIYLLKLLEASERFHPDCLTAMLDQPTFAYASVPYRIRSHEAILRDPRSTIDYDADAAASIEERVRSLGADGRLLPLADGSICLVSMMEKLLVPLLAKLSNFVPGGGIWMNTQRPEWNDANNALVGFGVSVVTLGYVHRYLRFLVRLLEKHEADHPHELSIEVANWMAGQAETLRLGEAPDPQERRVQLDRLGEGASAYRSRLYREGLSGDRTTVATRTLRDFLQIATARVGASLRANQREDGLFHSYNLLAIAPDGGIGLERLAEMLEGQVSILSSGLLQPTEAVVVLDSLRRSRLYRKDQASYILYPDRVLPGFLKKNRISPAAVQRSRLLDAMLEKGDGRIAVRDREGVVRFSGSLRNGDDLRTAIDGLAGTEWEEEARREREVLEEIYEETFRHRAFTGRSSNFFAYGGLGSIYWHMVSKLLLAIQENHREALRTGADGSIVAGLVRHYHETLEGLGFHKTPAHYGAFPTDAYSHTPAHAGVQQPGMTGQVKEDLLARWYELGVEVENGCLSFEPRLLRRSEFFATASRFETRGLRGEERALDLQAGTLAFTYCQTPVIYILGGNPVLELHGPGPAVTVRDRPVLTRAETASILGRRNEFEKIVVRIDPDQLASFS